MKKGRQKYGKSPISSVKKVDKVGKIFVVDFHCPVKRWEIYMEVVKSGAVHIISLDPQVVSISVGKKVGKF